MTTVIDLDISVVPSLLERDGDVSPYRASDAPPTIQIVLSNFEGGRGNGYSIRPNINFYAHAVLNRSGREQPYPCRMVVHEHTESYVKPGGQYALTAEFRCPLALLEGDTVRAVMGWRAHAFLLVEDGRGSSRQVWLPQGQNGNFELGDGAAAKTYALKFEVVK